ncbi:hypothetical protein [Acidiphilium sp.]|uniref:hypothetical protein n=1 Tax=Acidiphilium sp. TaxID=527 RepID=UPI0025863736|nr:hypothetical protein [Acidiphilium sp.]
MVENRSKTVALSSAALDTPWENGALWLFFPDYRGSVPYQSLLAAALAERTEVESGTIAMALEAAARRRSAPPITGR